jgi:hypothetical protein
MDELRKKPIQCLIASIALSSMGGVALIENLGFAKVD